MATPSPRPSNSAILQQLTDGTARLHLHLPLFPLFARITSHPPLPLEASSPALHKVEHYSVLRVRGDGRCMFRALAKGMARNKGIPLNPRTELNNAGLPYPPAPLFSCISFTSSTEFFKDCLLVGGWVGVWASIDDLRMAVKQVICDSGSERHNYEEALLAITIDEPLRRYCQRIARPDFWGGESELLVLSKLCRQPIIVYIPEREHSLRGTGKGFIPIAEYGMEFGKSSKQQKERMPVRLLYSGRNHYDLLV